MYNFLELVLIIVALLLQLSFARKIYIRSSALNAFMSFGVHKLKIVRYNIPEKFINEVTPVSVYLSRERYLLSPQEQFKEFGDNKCIPVSQITIIDAISSDLFDDVLSKINSYLIKNKSAVCDFNLIKDIVDRQCDTVDEEVNNLLPVPLYIGLAGTVFGIIIGLFSLNSNVTSTEFVNSIGTLIDGIKFAMICSLVGLVTTTVLSTVFYRKHKSLLEKQKNEFFFYIQSELLPILSNDAGSILMTLQRNLNDFNVNFNSNVNKFSSVMSSLSNNFESQSKIISSIEKLDLANMASFNIKVLKELNKSVDEFEKFNQYMSQMNSFVLNSASLNDKVVSMLQRTETIKEVVTDMKNNSLKFEQTMVVLNEFLTLSSGKDAFINTSNDISRYVAKQIEKMKEVVDNQLNEFNKYTSDSSFEFKKLIDSNNGNLDQLSNLKSLDKLSNLDNLTNLDKLSVMNEFLNINNLLLMEIKESRNEMRKIMKEQNGHRSAPYNNKKSSTNNSAERANNIMISETIEKSDNNFNDNTVIDIDEPLNIEKKASSGFLNKLNNFFGKKIIKK